MKTTATQQEDGSWLLNGEKLWCTNSVVADVIVVMAVSGKKTSKSGREFNEISAFILEMDTPGVDVLHRCEFMGGLKRSKTDSLDSPMLEYLLKT